MTSTAKVRTAWPTRELVVDFFRRDVPPGQAVTIATICESAGMRLSTAHCAASELIELGVLALAGRDKSRRGGPWTIKRGAHFDRVAEVRAQDEESRAAMEPPAAQVVVASALARRTPLEMAWLRPTAGEEGRA